MHTRSSTRTLAGASLALAALGACGSGSGGQPHPDAGSDTSAADGLDAPGGAGGSSGADALEDGATSPDGSPSSSDLEGAWYATSIPQPDGGLARHQRIRFAGGTYYLVYNTPGAYCGEVGAFRVVGGAVSFAPDHVEGGTACPAASARVEPVHWTADGVAFDAAAGVTAYRRARAVPKLFLTFEAHDGNIAGDPSLPGVFAIDKADAICARSIAKPDGASYKALLADGLRRTALPARDWVLAPDTTYFQADGVLNVFTSSADAASGQEHHDILSDGPPYEYAWIWTSSDATSRTTSCRSWTSNSPNDTGALSDASSIAGVSGFCNSTYPFICVASPLPGAAGTDGGVTDAGAGANDPTLQGAWTSPGDSIDAGAGGIGRRRLRFDADRYYLVVEGSGSYCGETGSFQDSGTGVTFAPQRVVGTGSCTIGTDRVEALDVGAGQITLSIAGSSRSYVRAPNVAKLFATLEVHGGDFADDTVLTGSNAVEKADSFCNRSTARPDGQTYKAVLADGVHRVPSVDWPLLANTQYFDSGGATSLFTANSSGLITGSAAAGALVAGAQYLYLWTGMQYDSSARADAVSTNTCSGWTSADASLLGAAADGSSSYTLVSGVVGGCNDIANGIICASQP
jgi:hypothetical protein